MKPIRCFSRAQPVIGMVHLAPLPGSPRWGGSLDSVFRSALRDAEVLASEGVDGILVENFGDAPFYPGDVPPETVAAMATVLARLRAEIAGKVVWGVNVLRNDARAALAVAASAPASFIRVNVHTGVTATDQGLLEGQAHETMRLRARLAPGAAIFADALVKHGRSLDCDSLAGAVRDLCERGLADAVLVTGSRTGEAPPEEAVEEAGRAAGSIPVMVASGVTSGNVADFLRLSGGVIVGTALKRGGLTAAPVDRGRVRAFLRRAAGSGRRRS